MPVLWEEENRQPSEEVLTALRAALLWDLYHDTRFRVHAALEHEPKAPLTEQVQAMLVTLDSLLPKVIHSGQMGHVVQALERVAGALGSPTADLSEELEALLRQLDRVALEALQKTAERQDRHQSFTRRPGPARPRQPRTSAPSTGSAPHLEANSERQ